MSTFVMLFTAWGQEKKSLVTLQLNSLVVWLPDFVDHVA